MRTSIPGRAVTGGLVGVRLVNLRDFGKGNYRQIDDYAFGSGGMVLAAPQLKEALDSVKTESGKKPYVVYPSPQGALISQEIIETLAHQEHTAIICGHYEGIDERFVERYVDLEVSIGDCVLTGGEIPAMLIVDAMSRLVPGAVGKSKAVIEDSFYRGMLDNPNYTRPAMWEGLKVPEVLTGGNAHEISRWRRREAIRRTLTRRPDLVSRASVREYISGVNVAVIAENESVNLAGLAEICRAYDAGRPYVIAESHELREAMKREYPEAKIIGSVKKLSGILGENVMTVKVAESAKIDSLHSLEVKRKCLEHDGNVLFIFAQNDRMLEGVDGLTGYIFGESSEIPISARIAIALDRFIGKR